MNCFYGRSGHSPESFMALDKCCYWQMKNMKKNKIAILGLGYVGLPLAKLFGTKYSVVGFDINKKRVS